MTVIETVNATKTRLGPEEARKLLSGVKRVMAARGKRIVTFDLTATETDREEVLSHLIGPTGNLRAPTARVGTTLLVGFSEEMYRDVLEGSDSR